MGKESEGIPGGSSGLQLLLFQTKKVIYVCYTSTHIHAASLYMLALHGYMLIKVKKNTTKSRLTLHRMHNNFRPEGSASCSGIGLTESVFKADYIPLYRGKNSN